MFRLHGVVLGPDGEERSTELFVADGLIADGPLSGAETLIDGGFIVPGLVDAHCHVGLGPTAR